LNQIQFGKSIIKYSIIKTKRVKTSQIVVDRDNVIVRTPLSKSKLEIENIVKNKAGWIYKKQFEFKKQKISIVKPTFSNGSTLPYLGKNCILEVKINQNKTSIQFTDSKFTISLDSKRPLKKMVKTTYDNWLQKKSNNYLKQRTQKLAIKIGINPSQIVVKSLKERWGIAKEGGIILNQNMLKAPQNMIDYIIIHELCHLRINDHSAKYWKLVRNFVPNYEEKIKWFEVNNESIQK
jgi:predicted metal-dependent hydrolase